MYQSPYLAVVNANLKQEKLQRVAQEALPTPGIKTLLVCSVPEGDQIICSGFTAEFGFGIFPSLTFDLSVRNDTTHP